MNFARAAKSVGRSTNNSTNVKAAPPKSKKAVFCISNVDQHITSDELTTFLSQDMGVDVLTIFKLSTNNNRKNLSSAFRVCIRAEQKDSLLNCDELPEGIVVREWIFKTQLRDEQLNQADYDLTSANEFPKVGSDLLNLTASAPVLSANVLSRGGRDRDDKRTTQSPGSSHGNARDSLLRCSPVQSSQTSSGLPTAVNAASDWSMTDTQSQLEDGPPSSQHLLGTSSSSGNTTIYISPSGSRSQDDDDDDDDSEVTMRDACSDDISSGNRVSVGLMSQSAKPNKNG
jgi:hypothetical protein